MQHGQETECGFTLRLLCPRSLPHARASLLQGPEACNSCSSSLSPQLLFPPGEELTWLVFHPSALPSLCVLIHGWANFALARCVAACNGLRGELLQCLTFWALQPSTFHFLTPVNTQALLLAQSRRQNGTKISSSRNHTFPGFSRLIYLCHR